jgi:hypothetical protein
MRTAWSEECFSFCENGQEKELLWPVEEARSDDIDVQGIVETKNIKNPLSSEKNNA